MTEVTIPTSNQIQEASLIYRLFPGETMTARALRSLLSSPQVVICFIIVGIFIAIAILGFLDFLPDFQKRIGKSYEMPSFLSIAQIFGTDLFGRSVLYKVMVGAKTAIVIGLFVTAIAVPVGVTLGALAGYFGGKIDAFIVWLYSTLVSVPYILLVIAISFLLGKGLASVCIAMGSLNWIGLCRLVRGEVLKQKNKEYVMASQLLGASTFNIIFSQILPNVMHLAIITASLMVLNAIKSEVILTFLGVGITNGASWGTMIGDAPSELVNGHWWPLATVALAMFLLIYSLNVIGDALRDALDPKLGH